MDKQLQKRIEHYYDRVAKLNADTCSSEIMTDIDTVLAKLDDGSVRVAEPNSDGEWQVNEWVQKGILLSLKLKTSHVQNNPIAFDKLDIKFKDYKEVDFQKTGVRVVPGAIIRQGCFLSPGVVAMPCFVNIGAHVGENTMIDTWATVGSGAQIGKNVHLSGGVGIGGVLEPLGASPVIIEDDCFIGARSEIVEGVTIGKGSVIAMGVFISKSSKIYDRTNSKFYSGHIPPGSVVVPGSIPDRKSVV